MLHTELQNAAAAAAPASELPIAKGEDQMLASSDPANDSTDFAFALSAANHPIPDAVASTPPPAEQSLAAPTAVKPQETPSPSGSLTGYAPASCGMLASADTLPALTPGQAPIIPLQSPTGHVKHLNADDNVDIAEHVKVVAPVAAVVLPLTTPGDDMDRRMDQSEGSLSMMMSTSTDRRWPLEEDWGAPVEGEYNLLVAGLCPTVDDALLHELFAHFGPIRSAVVMLDIATNRHRGFGLVRFADQDDAESAMATMHSRSFRSHTLRVTASPHSARWMDTIFVRNLPSSITGHRKFVKSPKADGDDDADDDEEAKEAHEQNNKVLADLFSQRYGTIDALTHMVEPCTDSVLCRVQFRDVAAARVAVRELHGATTVPKGLVPDATAPVLSADDAHAIDINSGHATLPTAVLAKFAESRANRMRKVAGESASAAASFDASDAKKLPVVRSLPPLLLKQLQERAPSANGKSGRGGQSSPLLLKHQQAQHPMPTMMQHAMMHQPPMAPQPQQVVYAQPPMQHVMPPQAMPMMQPQPVMQPQYGAPQQMVPQQPMMMMPQQAMPMPMPMPMAQPMAQQPMMMMPPGMAAPPAAPQMQQPIMQQMMPQQMMMQQPMVAQQPQFLHQQPVMQMPPAQPFVVSPPPPQAPQQFMVNGGVQPRMF